MTDFNPNNGRIRNNQIMSPLINIHHEIQDVPYEIKKSFQPDMDMNIFNNIIGDQKKNLTQIFANQYSIVEEKNKVNSFKICAFCLQFVQKDYKAIKSKTLNEIYRIHNSCFADFELKESHKNLAQLNQLIPAQYVLGEEQDEQNIIQSDHYKQAYIQITYYHPISNKIIYEIIKKVNFFQYENSAGWCKFKFIDGYILDPEIIAIPYQSFRFSLKIVLLNSQDINNKTTLTSVISTKKKLKTLKTDSDITLKLTSKKGIFKINAQTKQLDSLKRVKIPENIRKEDFSIVAFNSIELLIYNLFSQKKRKQIFHPINNYSTYSQKGPSKRKVQQVDLSPQTRSIDKAVVNKAQIQKQKKQKQKDLQFEGVSQSDLSFKQYKQPKQKSDNSRLSYISKQLNVEQIQYEIANKCLHAYLKTQVGSRNMQKYISRCKEQDIEIILNSIDQHIPSLMIDHYANFFFKTLCQVCSPRNRIFILTKIYNNIEQIAKDKKGTHSLQTLVSMINSSNQENALVQLIEKHLLSLSKDEQGTHILKKMIGRLSEQKNIYIFEKLKDNLLELSLNQYGIIVVKELMSKVKGFVQKRTFILQILDKNFEELIQNSYGNYALQHAIEIFSIKQCQKIINKVLNRVALYSNQKISSNVVEKCIMNTNQDTKNKFITAIAKDDVILEIMKNKFGNFVLEKALKIASKGQHKLLITAISRNVDHIQTNTGMRQKWKNYIEDY